MSEQDVINLTVRLAERRGKLETLTLLADAAIAAALKCELSPEAKVACEMAAKAMMGYWEDFQD